MLEGAMMSSEYDSGAEVCEAGFFASGRMIIHGGHSFISSARSGVDDSVSHSFSFFATQGFWVHRSLEKYALHAEMLSRG